jgi:hypothetical protein
MSGYYRRSGYRQRTGGAGSRWMNLRYAGTCKVCAKTLPAGTFAYWDASARMVTCERIECAEADGLTEVTQRWAGNPDGVVTRRAFRVGSGAPVHPSAEPKRTTTYRFNSGATYTRNAPGRCIDAPCCGCCDY